MKRQPLQQDRRVNVLCLLVVVITCCPYWHVLCNDESSVTLEDRIQENADFPDKETPFQNKEQEERLLSHEAEETRNMDLKTADHLRNEDSFQDCTGEEEHNVDVERPGILEPGMIPDEASVTEPGLKSNAEPPLDKKEHTASTVSDMNTVFSSTSEISPVASLSEASLLNENVDNISSHGKEKTTKPDLGTKIPTSKNASEKQKPASNTSANTEEPKQQDGKTDEHSIKVINKDPEDIPTFDEWKKKVMEVEKEKSQSLHPSSSGGPNVVKKVQKNRNNYASVECGAKILSANPEAKSTSAILIENMDLYMLNPCSAKIWFVIELCEPIQVKQLDVANYELFSSTPKNFLVSISDRYPTNKWIKLGTFHARDERTVQSFPLDEQMYAKYVKVELISHFGAEHFCPLSLVRVFGTSMVEEYEEIADSQYHTERQDLFDEDYDYPLDYAGGEDKNSKNLLGSATNAILNMVNIAANILGANSDGKDTSGTQVNGSFLSVNITSEADLPTPTPVVAPALQTVEANLANTVQFGLPTAEPSVSAQAPIVQLVEDEEEDSSLLSTVTLIDHDDEDDKSAWYCTESHMYCNEMSISCAPSFLEYVYKWCSAEESFHRQLRKTIAVIKPPETLITVQPDLPELEQPHSVTVSQETILPSVTDAFTDKKAPDASGDIQSIEVSETLINQSAEPAELEPSRTAPVYHSAVLDTTSIAALPEATSRLMEDRIVDIAQLEAPGERQSEGVQDTATAVMEDAGEVLDTVIRSETEMAFKNSVTLQTMTKVNEVVTSVEHTSTVSSRDVEKDKDVLEPQELETLLQMADTLVPSLAVDEEEEEEEEQAADELASVLQRTATDFYAESQNASELVNSNGNQVHGSSQKESVFMRLNNRIKALEMNMSLSSRYLEELSQRYRKQMEEMQKAFNKTIIKLQNTSRIAEEQDQRQTEAIQLLQEQLANMSKIVTDLSATVAKLQQEVSDRQAYLVVSLVLCVILGLMLCVLRCKSVSQSQDPEMKIPKSNHYPSPKRCFSSYDDMNLKRRTSYPMMRSKSFQLHTTDVGPDDLFIVEPLKFSPEKKKKRCKMKSERIETLKPVNPVQPVQPMVNGNVNSCQPFTHQKDFSKAGDIFTSSCKGPPSEGSSETSSQSEESYFCGISACSTLCNGQQQKTKAEKRALKRRRSKPLEQGKFIKNLIHTNSGSMASLHNILKNSKELRVGTFGVAAVSEHD